MTSQDKLIKQGIKYTDKLFDEISNRLERGVLDSDTLEAFLEKTKEYTTSNPLVSSGYDKTMLKLILSETNNHKFSRPAQKELVRVTIEEQVGELIKDVGEDIKDSVRDIVKEGYNNGLSQDRIAENISHKVSAIKGRRARAIARTEIARTATISDYVINKEMGATHFYVECRNTACPICKENWLKNPDKVATGKGLMGDKTYSMNDTQMLPPVHPNCRCVPYFINENDGKEEESKPEPTPEQLKRNLKPGEREKYNQYKRNIERQREWLKSNPDAGADEIAKHQKRLKFLQGKFEELRVKALGGKGGKVKPKPEPKPTPKPKPKETPKPKENPKKKTPKPKTETPKEKPINITQEQLEKGLDPVELGEYRRKVKLIEKIKKWLDNDPLSHGFSEGDVTRQKEILKRELKELEGLKKRALTSKPKSKNVSESVKLESPFDKSKHLTKEQLDKMDFKQLAEHHGAEYKGVQVYDYDGKKYHTIEQTCSDGRKFVLRFEEGAVKSYTIKGIATPNEIIHEVFKVPEALRIETREIWFKNTQHGITHKLTKSGYDTLGTSVGGYNLPLRPIARNFKEYDDYHHRIVINPKYFKGGGKGRYAFIWKDDPDDARNWKMTIVHEFTHSADTTKKMWEEIQKRGYLVKDRVCLEDDYTEIHKAEPYFTWYADTKISESFAEHGGYIGYMESNPSEQSKRIKVTVLEDGKIKQKNINYEEYKQLYPKHYAYFMRKFKEGF